MNDIATPMLQVLEKFLNLTSQRHQLITANMANIDTPGYQTRDVDFRNELVRAIDSGDESVTPVAHVVRNLMQRPDGNNVSLDREGLLLAETQMQFNLGVQLVKQEFSTLMTAINEGGKA